MKSGRFAPVLFKIMENGGPAGYFTSRASDDGETRDGWDKYYMARDAAICLKKLDKAGVSVPNNVRDACEKIKLTYNFDGCDPHGGMFYDGSDGYWMYGILSEPELFKDLCLVKDIEGKVGLADMKPLLIHYNTTSLSFYLSNSDEEDLDFIKKCVANHADLSTACDKAIENIQKRTSKSNRHGVQPINITQRIQFIQLLLTQN